MGTYNTRARDRDAQHTARARLSILQNAVLYSTAAARLVGTIYCLEACAEERTTRSGRLCAK